MALEDLTTWISRTRTELARFTASFEDNYGYEPDDQDVIEASDSDTDLSSLPPDVASLFGRISEISWPDVWNGYFVGPAAEMIKRKHENEPGSIAIGSDVHDAMQIGSDGGGAYFVFDIDAGGTVLRVSDATVDNGILHGTVTQLAPNLDGFLEALTTNLEAVNRGQRPPF